MTTSRTLSCLLCAAVLSSSCGGSQQPAQAADPARPARHGKRHPKKRAIARATPAPELDPGQIVLGLRGHEQELHECFVAAGASDPAFVEIGWRVTTEGVVENARVLRSTATDAVAPCLMEHLSEARFGSPATARSATWTFVGGLVRFEDAETRRRNRKHRGHGAASSEGESGIVIERSSPGKLDPDTVEDIVHVGYKLFAHCYRDGLDRDPQLGGAVRLRFVIGTDGHVARVIDGGSDIPDENVVVCIAESFFALKFPKPSGGNVHLRYRMHFDSG